MACFRASTLLSIDECWFGYTRLSWARAGPRHGTDCCTFSVPAWAGSVFARAKCYGIFLVHCE